MRTTSGRGLVDHAGPTASAGHRAPPITAAVLVRQVADVIADVPRFLTAPLLRHRRRTWGATEEEVAATMPGDDLLPRAQYRCTRAITISAPPDEVWPWLVQVGYGRSNVRTASGERPPRMAMTRAWQRRTGRARSCRTAVPAAVRACGTGVRQGSAPGFPRGG